jgi:hypothetical protein
MLPEGSAQGGEKSDRLCRIFYMVGIRRQTENADQAVLREGAGRPLESLFAFDPLVGAMVMKMMGIHQCNQHVDVEQRSQMPSSSRI